MSQNNMANFITLTDLDAYKVEINPAFIVMMKRDSYNPKQNVEMPMTIVYLSNGFSLYAQETPEQIAQLQMDAVAKIMKNFANMAENMFDQLEEDI